MAEYSSYSLRAVKRKFGLIEDKSHFTIGIQPITPTDLLVQTLERNLETMGLNNEKSRSEFVVAPIMMEVAYRHRARVSVYSGENLEADKNEDLNGECDFIISGMPRSSTIEIPIICLVECENDNLMSGTGQCVAQMLGAQIVNERDGNRLLYIYGCVTTGNDWKFLKMQQKTIYTDITTYYLKDVGQILGIFQRLIEDLTPPNL
jgi:hypothetical protein